MGENLAMKQTGHNDLFGGTNGKYQPVRGQKPFFGVARAGIQWGIGWQDKRALVKQPAG